MQLMHHSEFDIFKMECRMVADKFNEPVTIPLPSAFGKSNVGCIGNGPAGMAYSVAPYQQTLVFLRYYTSRHDL